MIKINITRAFFVVALVAMVGCVAVQQPISFSLSPETAKGSIGIVQVESPVPGAQYTGNIGLLDLAIIAAANGGLNKHLKQQDFAADYQKLPTELQGILEAKGYKVVMIDKDINTKVAAKFKAPVKGVNKTNFSSYKTQYGVDHLLILAMPSVGTTRSYYGPIPTSEPLATATISVELVDLNSNKVEWFSRETSSHVIEKPWDEGSKNWPNLTNAVFTSVDEAVKLIKTELQSPELAEQKLSLK